MAEYSKLARGSFTYSGAAGTPQIINLPFVPQKVEAWDYTSWGNPTAGVNYYTYWDSSLGQGKGLNSIWESTGTSPATPYQTSALQSTACVSTFYTGPGVVFGPQQQVVSITKAAPTVVTVNNHGYSNGDVVTFEGLKQSGVGMPQITTLPFTVLNVTTNTFEINWNTVQSNYTAITGSPANSFVKKIINPENYYPGVNFINAMILGSNTVIGLTKYPDYSIGQLVGFRIPAIWGTTQLNSGQNPDLPGFVIYGTVTGIYGNDIVVNIDSTNFTPFNSNIPFNAVSGLSYAQVVAVGDQNNGSVYPMTGGSPTIPGAFVNNTSKGFVLGTNSLLSTASSGDKILWEAKYYDYVQDM
jgi:hypothetical protein